MTEYDYSPEAYERYIANQHRISNWVDRTEQHRPQFQSVVTGAPQDLSRSGPVSHPRLIRSPPPPPRQYPGQSQPMHYPPPSVSSDSSDSSYEGPWPHSMPQKGPPMMLPQQPAFRPMQQPLAPPPPMMMPPTFMAPQQRVSHHHRPHDKRRSQSQHPRTYYSLVSPPLSPPYQQPYPMVMNGGHQGYFMMPQYSGMQAPVISGQAMMSTPAGIPQSPPYAMGVSSYQPLVVQQPANSPYIVPIAHQRVYNLSKLGSGKYSRHSIG